MRSAIFISLLAPVIAGLNVPSIGLDVLPTIETRDNCPAIWTTISADLYNRFLDRSTNPPQCNDNARAAIRAAFHDCGSWDNTQGTTGGCDGSLILANEITRAENKGLEGIIDLLRTLQSQTYPSVSVADLIQYASAVAILACPGGPKQKIAVGRKDSSKPAPNGNLPPGAGPGSDAVSLLNLFKKKGFNEAELAALLGAHTCSKQFSLDPTHFASPQDTTPGVWDVNYYGETLKNTTFAQTGTTIFPSDVNLATDARTGVAKEVSDSCEDNLQLLTIPSSKALSTNKGNGRLPLLLRESSASCQEPIIGANLRHRMNKMSLLGVPNPGKLIDCTGTLPNGTPLKRRSMRSGPFNPFHG